MTYFADLHIHVGINEDGKWVKIPSSRKLTVRNILKTAKEEKGLDVIGIIDALSPLVQKDIKRLIAEGELKELVGGGYCYQDSLVVLLGGELETREESGGLAHSLFFLPTLEEIQLLSGELSRYIKNINISSQNTHMNLQSLYNIGYRYRVKMIPAHIFTPFKSVYGNCSDRMQKLFTGEIPKLSAVELGLSADSFMAGRISELADFSFVVSSDAHSLANIAREFTEIDVEGELNFENIFSAIEGRRGHIKTLYGFNPRLGKYYTTRCAVCSSSMVYGTKKCTVCGGRVVRGVKERIDEIADVTDGQKILMKSTAPYRYHIPLAQLPGIGKKTLEKISCTNLPELCIIYRTNVTDLENLLGSKFTENIIKIRKNEFSIKSGGAGHYGRVIIR